MESIGNLAGGIAHDFNNILSPILIYSEMAMADLPSESRLRYYLKQIYNAGDRAKDLVKQILTFSRKKEGERIPIMVSPIIKEALKMLRASIPTTIEIHQNLEAKEDIVVGDPTQIHQVLMNLCSNAADAMGEKGGIIEVGLYEEEIKSEDMKQSTGLNPGHYLRLSVSDNGHGMDEGILTNIFEPYFTTKEKGKGTGLGLAVVHGIIKSYGGDISVESELGTGTTFNAMIPRNEGGTFSIDESKLTIPQGNERVLFIDDEIQAAEANKHMLENLGYRVTVMTDSLKALEFFSKKPDEIDLVITDMTMPNMTGRELAEKIRSIRSNIPIIICTGYSEQIDENKAKEAGIKAFVMKPIAMGEMAQIIREVLDKGFDLSMRK
jgi:CheY-like chemotaxis protein